MRCLQYQFGFTKIFKWKKHIIGGGALKDKLTFIDLFAGAGGLTEGFKQAGFKPVFATDIWQCAAETYALNHKGISIGDNFLIRDIKNLRGLDIFETTCF